MGRKATQTLSPKPVLPQGCSPAWHLPGGSQEWHQTASHLLDDLLQEQAPSGWFVSIRDKTTQDKQLTGCLIQFLLGREPAFQSRSQSRGTDLAGAITREANRLSPEAETLWIASACFTGFSTEHAITYSPEAQDGASPSLFTAAA